MRSVSALFAGLGQLLYAFNMFLPTGCDMEVPALNVTPRRGALVIHSGGAKHGARELTRGARSALIIWTKRTCTFDNFRHVPDDVQRKHVLQFLTWRDEVAFATATTRCRRLVAPVVSVVQAAVESKMMCRSQCCTSKLWRPRPACSVWK